MRLRDALDWRLVASTAALALVVLVGFVAQGAGETRDAALAQLRETTVAAEVARVERTEQMDVLIDELEALTVEVEAARADNRVRLRRIEQLQQALTDAGLSVPPLDAGD